jgi:hypothetical protein
MYPGTMGGQSRVATPLSPLSLLEGVIVRTLTSCEVFTVVSHTFIGTTSEVVTYPDGNSGDFLYLLVTADNNLSSTPSSWTVVSGVVGPTGYERRLYVRTSTPRGSEESVTLNWSSPSNAQVIIINVRVGDPSPKAVGSIGALDQAVGINGSWSSTISLFTPDTSNPGQTLIVPWFESSGVCDAWISETDGGVAIDPYIDVTLDSIPGDEEWAKQMIVAVKNPSAATELWGNYTVPGAAETRAVFALRVQEVTCE